MKASDMRPMEIEELETRLAEWEEQLFRRRCEKKIGQLDNLELLRQTRRNIARAKTIMNEKRHAANRL